jgi:hypothetical protein
MTPLRQPDQNVACCEPHASTAAIDAYGRARRPNGAAAAKAARARAPKCCASSPARIIKALATLQLRCATQLSANGSFGMAPPTARTDMVPKSQNSTPLISPSPRLPTKCLGSLGSLGALGSLAEDCQIDCKAANQTALAPLAAFAPLTVFEASHATDEGRQANRLAALSPLSSFASRAPNARRFSPTAVPVHLPKPLITSN